MMKSLAYHTISLACDKVKCSGTYFVNIPISLLNNHTSINKGSKTRRILSNFIKS